MTTSQAKQDAAPVPDGPAGAATAEPGQGQSPEQRGSSFQPVKLPPPRKGPDKAFSGVTTYTGIFLVGLVTAIFTFLLLTAIGPLSRNEASFFTSTEWTVTESRLAFGIADLMWTTVISSVIAMVLAVPVAIGVALLISQYTPPRVGMVIGFTVDLLAAVPSVVYGLWGMRVFGPVIAPFGIWISESPLGRIPLFAPGLQSTGTVFAASLVLAIMILPIITALSRDVFEQTPRDHIEAAWALGATKWEMIRTAVIPYGRSGVVAASMLGLGRALGETIAVMLILSAVPNFDWSIFSGGETFASKIANGAPEFDSPTKTGAYIAAGLVLFLLTFAVNAVARGVAAGGKAKS